MRITYKIYLGKEHITTIKTCDLSSEEDCLKDAIDYVESTLQGRSLHPTEVIFLDYKKIKTE